MPMMETVLEYASAVLLFLAAVGCACAMLRGDQ